MKISESIGTIHALAAREAIKRHHKEIEPEHVMLCLLRLAASEPAQIRQFKIEADAATALAEESGELKAEFKRQGIEPGQCRRQLSELLVEGTSDYGGWGIHRTPACRQLFERGAVLARASDHNFRALHLLQALFAEPTPLISTLLSKWRQAACVEPAPAKDNRGAGAKKKQLDSPDGKFAAAAADRAQAGADRDDLSSFAQLTSRLRKLRKSLQERIFGQDHAIEAFIEGLFDAEITADADKQRRAPRSVFVFAGPPGVGKTFLAEAGADALSRPFRRYDMSAFSGHNQGEALIGFSSGYQGAQPGLLTEFVEKHADAILLFDEIEKAHLNTIHYFLQILDAGRLQDRYSGNEVCFRDTTVIFTTNVGKQLYDNPQRSGVHRANAAFLRQTIIDALASEINPRTDEPYFPQAICSRLGAGYPVLFNHLGVNELTRVAAAEAGRTAELIAGQLEKKIEIDPLLPLLMVMKEGGQADARVVTGQARAFIKNEIFKTAQLFSDEHLKDALRQIDSISFEVEKEEISSEPALESLLKPVARPRVLLVGSSLFFGILSRALPEVDWCAAESPESAMAALAEAQPDFALVDLWLGGDCSDAQSGMGTIAHFDQAPPAARHLERGQELLRKMHERAPSLPIILLLVDSQGRKNADRELLSACIRAGGAREALSLSIEEEMFEHFRSDLLLLAGRLTREKAASKVARQRKVLDFDTAPLLDTDRRILRVRLRNLRLARALKAADAGEVLADVERPQDRFDDVIGADSAKEELRFFIDYLKNPRRFLALGLKPPRGILLWGPPGTGKTMLARALAGETDLAFMAAAASSFVTMWQGSGPENVRKLFERARRYAPAIVFIDEIDAIGRTRTGSPSGHGEEMALNALLTEMDGFSGTEIDRPVFVLAATNFRVEDDEYESGRTLDPALVRRFSRAIFVDLPDLNARRRYFAIHLKEGEGGKVSSQAIDLAAHKSTGMSIANLEQVLEASGRAAFRKGVELNDDIFLEALDTVRDGEAKEWTRDLLEGTAWHEAGHTLMYWLSGWCSPEVSIVARASRGGGMFRAAEELKREALTRNELLARIRMLLAGRDAEMLHLGEAAGLSTGASSDLERASDLARRIICRYGMDETFGPATMNEMLERPEALGTPLYREIQQRVAEIVKEQDALTRQSLDRHKQELASLASALLEKNRLYKADVEALLAGLPKGKFESGS
jgi:cell division protease FtsH